MNLSPDRPTRGAMIIGPYRYQLWRDFEEGRRRICFVMLNPSTADGMHDDPTVRKCIYYARAWGFRSLEIVNLFSYRATDPGELLKVEAPVGIDTDRAIFDVTFASDMVVCAWGGG